MRSRPTGRRTARLVLLGLALTGGCQRVGIAPPAPPASVTACGARDVNTQGWVLVQDSTGVAYRMPPGFVEGDASDSPVRRFSYPQLMRGRVATGFSPSGEYYTSLRRVPAPGMQEMSECIDAVDGRQLLLQAWRMEDGIFRDRQRFDLFEVLVLVPVEPTRTFYVTGGGDDPRFQEIVLAIARSVEIRGR